MAAECKTCNAPIKWVRTRKGKRMPLDAEPTSDGDFLIEGDPDEDAPLSYKAPVGYTGEKFTSHFVTCPAADEWRRK